MRSKDVKFLRSEFCGWRLYPSCLVSGFFLTVSVSFLVSPWSRFLLTLSSSERPIIVFLLSKPPSGGLVSLCLTLAAQGCRGMPRNPAELRGTWCAQPCFNFYKKQSPRIRDSICEKFKVYKSLEVTNSFRNQSSTLTDYDFLQTINCSVCFLWIFVRQ